MQRALVAYQGGNWAEAERLCQLVLKTDKNNFDALNMLGAIAAQTRRTRQAVDFLGRAIAVDSSNAETHYNRGVVLKKLKRLDEALASYDRAIEIAPDYVDANYNRGNVLKDLKRLDEALASYDRAVKLKPDHANANYNRSVVLKDLERLDEALASYDRAIEIEPGLAEAHSNRGVVLRDLKRLDEALASYDRAIEIEPELAEAHNNRGVVLKDLRRLDEAQASYERAIEIGPDYASAHLNLSLLHLLTGDFRRGWEGYEWRRKELQIENFAQPLWMGAETLTGKTILLHSEQGFGDTLQFSRYAKMVADLGARVIVRVPETLLALLETLDGVAQLVAKDTALPEFDYHCPLLSLPLAFKTDAGSIPSGTPYIRSDPARVAAWRNRLGARTRPRVGLVWSGKPSHANDHNRSIALEEMLPLLDEGVEWVSLQTEVRKNDADLLVSRKDIRHFGKELKDFSDTAALVELMDLVVSVDTSVAHLAGAMGKSVWILLPFNPDWRWLLDRKDSPWYPTAQLFRQPAIGDWASVIGVACDKLRQRLAPA